MNATPRWRPPPCRPSASTALRVEAANAHRFHVQSTGPVRRVAVCITGLLASGKRDDSDLRRGWPVSDHRGYAAWRSWADELATYRVVVDFFMWLDTRIAVKPRLQGAEGWQRIGAPGYDPLQTPECNDSATQAPPQALVDAIAALRPVTVHTTGDEPCYCARRPCECLPPDAGLSFMEQMAKVRGCYDGVVARERSRGFAYDFVLKARSDYDTARNGVTARALVAAMDSVGSRILTHPWNIEPRYGNSARGEPRASSFAPRARAPRCTTDLTSGTSSLVSRVAVDWLWVAPRKLARVAFSLERAATCNWLRCVRAWLENTTTAAVSIGEGVLASYWLANGAPFEALLTDSAAHRNKTQNGICVFRAQDRGVVTPAAAAGLGVCTS